VKKKTTLLLLLLFAAFSMMRAQNSSQGKEFWISFMQNGYREYDGNLSSWVENTVMVSANRACTGTVRRACNPTESISFSVEDNGIVFLDIPETWVYNEGNEESIPYRFSSATWPRIPSTHLLCFLWKVLVLNILFNPTSSR